jgi:hypothetical protein
MHREGLTKDGSALVPAFTAFPEFYLAGGTALALQIGHRVSVDFDFFTPESLSRRLLYKVSNIFASEPLAPLVNNADQLTVLIRGVKVTFLTYPFPVIEPLVMEGGLSMLSVREIGATKAYTIGRRGTFKDYVDLYSIVSAGHASLVDVVRLADRKFGDAFNSRLFAEQLLFMDDVRDYEVEFLTKPITAKTIASFFRKEVRALPLA